MFLTRLPCAISPKQHVAFDLHVLRTPPAFVLSQDQTLHLLYCLLRRALLSQRGSTQLRWLLTASHFIPSKNKYQADPPLPRAAPLSASPRQQARFYAKPFFCQVFFTEFYFFLRCVAATEHPRAHSAAPAQERFLHAPALLTRVLLRPPPIFVKPFLQIFSKNYFYFMNIPVFTGNAQIKIFHALPQI